MTEKLLELRHISKQFSGVPALDDVSMDIRPGEVLTLVGENGAGKSTLIKVITGACRPSGGEIWFEGKKLENNTPAKSKALGIGVIYQELNMLPSLTVAENVFFGKELKKGIVHRRAADCRNCKSSLRGHKASDHGRAHRPPDRQ